MSVSAAAVAALSDGVKAALIGAFGAIAAALIAVGGHILYSRWERRRSLVLRAKRDESASGWQDLAGELTSKLGTMTHRADDVVASRATLARLQGLSQSELQAAFGRDSIVVCAERHIRELMQRALALAEEAVRAGDTDQGRKHLRSLSELNSYEIDDARWSVFAEEVDACRKQPGRDVLQPASGLDDRVKLTEAVQRYCVHPVACDLLPDRSS